MTSKKAMQRSILSSIIAIALCCTMMLGATWAWFADTVVNTGNTIASGVWGGAVGLEVLNAEGTWVNANTSTAPIFTCTDWMPGDSVARVIKVINDGNLDLDWEAAVVATENNGDLSDVIDVYYKWDVTENPTDITGWEYAGTLTECMTNNGLAAKLHGELTAHTEKTFGLALKFQDDADPRYAEQKVVFDFKVLATEVQPWTEEAAPDDLVVEDGAVKTETNITVTPTDDKAPVDAIAVTIPAGTKLEEGKTELKLTVTEVEEVNSNIQVMAGQETIAMEIDLEGLAADNQQEITVALTIEKGLSNVALYHYDELIDSTYDPATGVLTFTTTDFSPFTVVHGEVPAYTDAITANRDSYCEPTVEGAVVTIKPQGEIKWALSNFGAASTWNNWVGFRINTPEGVDASKVVITRPDGQIRILANVLDSGKTYASMYWGAANATEDTATYTIDWNADGHIDLTLVIDLTEATLELEPFTVTFVGFEGADLGTQTVRKGNAAEAPAAPDVEGYTFKGWDVAFDNVTENLTVTAIYEINKYTITWVINGVETEETYNYGEIPTWKGEKPTKPADEQYTYEFADWGEIAPVTGNASYVAIFKHVENAYTIIWTVNGEEFRTETLAYGTAIVAPEYEVPANTDQYTYTFAGWTVEEGATVTGTATFDATLTETVNQYKITWTVNGEEFRTETLAYGTAIVAPEYEVPANTDQYTYTFSGWTVEGATVTGDATFDATLTQTVKKYTVTFKNWDGSTLQSTEVEYGAMPAFDGKPTHPDSLQTSFTFAGWDSEIVPVTGEATYTATYTEGLRVINTTSVTNVTTVGAMNPAANQNFSNGANNMLLRHGATQLSPALPAVTLGADGKLYLGGWVMIDGGQRGIFWSLDKNTWTALTGGTYSPADTNVRDAASTLTSGQINRVDANAIFTDLLLDLSAYKGQTLTVYLGAYSAGGKMVDVATLKSVTIPYTVTFVDANGSTLKTELVAGGAAATAPEAPAAETGYHFVGWDTDFSAVNGDITVKATYEINTYTVIFNDYNGNEISKQTLTHGAEVVIPADPTREADAQYTYTFAGWGEVAATATADATYTATYNATLNKYTVTFVGKDGAELKKQEVEYGSAATAPEAPVIEGWTFVSWDKTFDNITGELTVKAIYSEETETPTYTVTWENWDGTRLELDVNQELDATPEYNGETPSKAADAQYTYTFAGWTPEIAPVTGDVTYVATFDKVANKYTVTWNVNGTITTETYEYGQTPAFKGSTAKAEDAQYTYTFTGWDKAIADVTDNVEYVAQYDQTCKHASYKNGKCTNCGYEDPTYITPAFLSTAAGKASISNEVTSENGFDYIHMTFSAGQPQITLKGGDVGADKNLNRYMLVRYRGNGSGYGSNYDFFLTVNGAEMTGGQKNKANWLNLNLNNEWHYIIVDLGTSDISSLNWTLFDGDTITASRGNWLDIEYVKFFGSYADAKAYEVATHPEGNIYPGIAENGSNGSITSANVVSTQVWYADTATNALQGSTLTNTSGNQLVMDSALIDKGFGNIYVTVVVAGNYDANTLALQVGDGPITKGVVVPAGQANTYWVICNVDSQIQSGETKTLRVMIDNPAPTVAEESVILLGNLVITRN